MILVFAAHPDDEVLGCGGTIAKYSKKEKVVAVIFSDGNIINESKEYIKKRRKESIDAGKILGISKTIFMGFPDNSAKINIKDEQIKKKVKKIISKYQPKTIFTHNADDPHPLHSKIAKLVKSCIEQDNIDIYTFIITSPLRILHRNAPKLYIDISKTIKLKRRALWKFKSQRFYLTYYKTISFIFNKIAGNESGYKYAEVFYKW